MKCHCAAAGAVLGLAVASPLRAELVDDKQPFICAALEIFSCDAGFQCDRETAESVDLPQFLKVSVDDKTIAGTRPSGVAVNARIEIARQGGQRLYLQGIAEKVAWTLTVGTATGRMTLVAADDVSGYVVFGACTGTARVAPQ
jgi:hypothetical protein